MKLALFALLLALGGPAPSAPMQERIPVRVGLVGDDGLTQKLADALELKLREDARLRPATSVDDKPLSIESDANVDWDELAGRTVLIYTVYVSSRGAQRLRLTGACFEDDVSKCAKDILSRSSRLVH